METAEYKTIITVFKTCKPDSEYEFDYVLYSTCLEGNDDPATQIDLHAEGAEVCVPEVDLNADSLQIASQMSAFSWGIAQSLAKLLTVSVHSEMVLSDLFCIKVLDDDMVDEFISEEELETYMQENPEKILQMMEFSYLLK